MLRMGCYGMLAGSLSDVRGCFILRIFILKMSTSCIDSMSGERDSNSSGFTNQ